MEATLERIDNAMNSVKDVSWKLGVSTTTVYNHINKLKDDIKGHTFNIKGTTYLDDEGIRQLEISMGLLKVPEVKENITIDNIIDEISNSVTENITNNIKNDYGNLRKEVKELKDQNEILINLIEDKQNKTLLEKVKSLFKKDKTV